MDVFTIVAAIFVAVLVGVFVLLLYSGFFYTYTIRCTIPASIPSSFAYTIYTGPYEKIGPVFGRLSQIAPGKTLFGVYYDDPKKVPASQLRSIVGCDLSNVTLSDRDKERFEKNGYSFDRFPECNKALVTEYPYRNYLSIWIAVRRVYPALMEYIQEHKVKNAGPCMEIYKNDAIQFICILDSNEDFYVPEISRDPPLLIGQDEGTKKTN